MFGKIFSKKTSKTDANSHGETLNDGEVEELIKESLTQYNSNNFPQGVLAVCQQLVIIQKSKKITIKLIMPFVCQGELDLLAQTLTEHLACTVKIKIELAIKPVRQFSLGKAQEISGQGSLPQGRVANIIAIASGKGGVGKSTTTVNLAYALIAEGASVGILDADIYGPSIPSMLGLKDEKPSSTDGKLMTPLYAKTIKGAKGLSAMSIGFLVDEADATVWRGPMASTAFNQLLNETDWPELDYLLIDMPPGTGDIQLTLAQKVPVAAAVIVTTPQDIALIDAVKGIAMFDKVKVPVLGIVENMSYHLCENCGHQSHIFGQEGGKHMAEDQETVLLGQLPLDITIRQDADFGESDIIENSAGEIANHYRKIARNVSAQLFLQCDNASPLTATITTRT
ncbi:MAG TPA: iron-sulfur cluster carrier protein ApbC [Colwellia sp.]|nr:iron-sulfur cluster carrier protein ApbC [Colwellia sp.]|tara:strand:- start:748 stop:1938 length:1191 start_codon:yes stop_codon:yes gene_type:complete